ncbi:MAG: hypothetical protein WA885_24840 [Phormidesmis sp.]
MITGLSKRLAGLAGFALGGLAIALSLQSPAQAQAAYGSYVGIGAGVGFGDGSDLSLVLSGRYNVLELPISIRGTAFIGDGSAFVPTISYDYPLNFNTELYLGAGVAIASDGSPVGDDFAFVLQPGIDYTMTNSDLVIFGNAIFAISGDSATSVQGGVGYQF